uniref:Phosphatidylinositol transfer protein N-terminal domain-containing protein n=1 Tax=Physcomitrium patens TaxID=3218 RepID=A0A2K1JE75_PHYPA|nr:phosphatidylinositol transfer protein 2-like isoform X1 [Physcomitrium patens]XP_024396362.1 phosphatidylinositol transfer protein 2-like isoform X1 [Physcomitrium patens]XP_024396364.1 phosphatidylinositol transfer protein 2-like isoform X1 [Physcomitrium patens]PNR39831.1 hypothetical protein PHYPA_020111 [Physcomitrium patens]|eukprot:XP_024396361.1 phosphatidylinositol transfer protein 2-like isoform X1 [Physcomitrella patens]
MVAVQEYRIVLPFTVEEYKIAQLYMVAKFSASESSGGDGDGVEVLKNEPYEENDTRGQYTHKIYHLANKLPSWLVSLVPKKALMLEEEAWNAYPKCTTVLKCPYFNKLRLILETTHLPDRGTTENALNLDAKTVKKRQVEFIDIAMDPVENYVESEDPLKFKSQKTGRGPLQEGWQKTCEPVMCAYKCVTVDVPYWGFGSRLEKFISKNAQRKILLEGHRKCFCWLDEWHGLTMEDVRRMEDETAEALAKARALVLKNNGAQENGGTESEVPAEAEAETTPKMDDHDKVLGSRVSSISRTKDGTGSPRLMRRPSLVGPSVAMGITTMSASDVGEEDGFHLASTAPPLPSPKWKSSSIRNSIPASSEKVTLDNGGGSSESFSSLKDESNWESANGHDDNEVAACVAVLDRAIAWAKARSAKLATQPSRPAKGVVAPIGSPIAGGPEDQGNLIKFENLTGAVTVIDKTMSAVKRRPTTQPKLSHSLTAS